MGFFDNIVGFFTGDDSEEETQEASVATRMESDFSSKEGVEVPAAVEQAGVRSEEAFVSPTQAPFVVPDGNYSQRSSEPWATREEAEKVTTTPDYKNTASYEKFELGTTLPGRLYSNLKEEFIDPVSSFFNSEAEFDENGRPVDIDPYTGEVVPLSLSSFHASMSLVFGIPSAIIGTALEQVGVKDEVESFFSWASEHTNIPNPEKYAATQILNETKDLIIQMVVFAGMLGGFGKLAKPKTSEIKINITPKEIGDFMSRGKKLEYFKERILMENTQWAKDVLKSGKSKDYILKPDNRLFADLVPELKTKLNEIKKSPPKEMPKVGRELTSKETSLIKSVEGKVEASLGKTPKIMREVEAKIQAKQDTGTVFTPEEFTKKITPYVNKYSDYLTKYKPSEYAGMDLYLSKTRMTGYGLRNGTEIVSVFNRGVSGAGKYALVDAIENGGRTLDVVEGPISEYYEMFGFEEVSRSPNWTEGKPDVIIMELNPQSYAKFKKANPQLYRGKSASTVFERSDGGIRGGTREAKALERIKGSEKLKNLFSEQLEFKITDIKREIKSSVKDFLNDVKASAEAGDPKVNKLRKSDTIIKLFDQIEATRDTIAITRQGIPVTKEWLDYAESIQGKDITPQLYGQRRVSLTAERIMEELDGKVRGTGFKELVEPVYKGEELVQKNMADHAKVIRDSKILRGTTASERMFKAGKGEKVKLKPGEQKLLDYIKEQYDVKLTEMNKVRENLNMEPIKRRKNYMTDIYEQSIVAELLGSFDRVSKANRISEIKQKYVSQGMNSDLALRKAKTEVEGLPFLEQYISPNTPSFRFAKEKLLEKGKQDAIRAFDAWIRPAEWFIAQAKNAAKNKAYIKHLPYEAQKAMSIWNKESVTGHVPSQLNPIAKKALRRTLGTIGNNVIVYNMGIVVLQLTSKAQVLIKAGLPNTIMGYIDILPRLVGKKTAYSESFTSNMRNLEVDFRHQGWLEAGLEHLEKYRVTKNAAAKTQHMVEAGKALGNFMISTADNLTVASDWHTFRRQGLSKGLSVSEAEAFADIWTGKTQANYFKTGRPTAFNEISNEAALQFGTYASNFSEFLRKDLGKDFYGSKSKTRFMKDALTFMAYAYMIDGLSNRLFGRDPYEIRPLVNVFMDYLEGDADGIEVLAQVAETAMGMTPLLGSIRYGGPPVPKMIMDILNLPSSSDYEKAGILSDLQRFGLTNLTPYGGSQIYKTLQGLETLGIEVPLIDDPSETASGKSKYFLRRLNTPTSEKAKAIILGPSSTRAAREYYKSK